MAFQDKDNMHSKATLRYDLSSLANWDVNVAGVLPESGPHHLVPNGLALTDIDHREAALPLLKREGGQHFSGRLLRALTVCRHDAINFLLQLSVPLRSRCKPAQLKGSIDPAV